jgi:hypothetical protein
MAGARSTGRFYWGSAWRLEPRRGNGSRDSGSRFF